MNQNQDHSNGLDHREAREFDAELIRYAHRRRVRIWTILLFGVPGLAMLVYVAVDEFRKMLGH